jgi:fused signal recognition particle receptor
MFEILKKKFRKIAEAAIKKIVEKKLSEKDLDPILNKLKTDLIEADVAYEVAEKISENLKNDLIGKEIKRGEEKEIVFKSLKKSLLEILNVPEIEIENLIKEKKPIILVFLGFNGSGKTTTIAKIANFLMKKGFSCVFAAADTFRAASLEQLEEHARKVRVKVIKHKYGADPAAVVYDAIKFAEAHGISCRYCWKSSY